MGLEGHSTGGQPGKAVDPRPLMIMASIYQLKDGFQGLLRPLVGRLAGRGVTANQMTMLACVLSFVAGFLLYGNPDTRWVLLLMPGVLLVRMALNAIDGMLAREHGMTSRRGAVLNELTDVLSDAALYLPYALVDGFRGDLVCVVVVLAVISEMTGTVGVQIGASRRYDGPMGKSDRAFVFGALALLAGLSVPIEPAVPFILATVIVLLVVTIVNRACKALKESNS